MGVSKTFRCPKTEGVQKHRMLKCLKIMGDQT